MKCQYKSCNETALGKPSLEIILSVDEDISQYYKHKKHLCKKHFAEWLRKKADGIEGLKECPNSTDLKPIIGHFCNLCKGTKKVPIK